MKKHKGGATRNRAQTATAADRRNSLRRALAVQRKKQEIKSKAGGMNLKRKENHINAINEQMGCSVELLDNVDMYLRRVGSAIDNDRSIDSHPRRDELIGAMDELSKLGQAYSDDLDAIAEDVKAFEADTATDPIILTRDSFTICEKLQVKRDEMARRMMSATALAEEIVMDIPTVTGEEK